MNKSWFVSLIRLPMGWLSLLLMFFAADATAQNTYQTITSASFTQLEQAFAYNINPGTNVISCQFNGTIVCTRPLFALGNTVLEVPTNYTVTISGSTGVRIFQVQSNVSMVLSNLTISGGNYIGTNGGAGLAGTVYNSGVSGHDGNSGYPGGDSYGGAIYNLGNTLAMYCIFVTNTATGGTGGAGGNGAPGTSIAGNGGGGGNGGRGLGGAIYNVGTLTVSNCDFIGNNALGGPGGLGGTNGAGYSAYPGNGGTGGLGCGGAIYNAGLLTNWLSSFVDNSCRGGTSQAAGQPQGNQIGSQGPDGGYAEGGGIYNVGTGIVVNCTIAQNTSTGGNGGNGAGGANGSRGGAGGSGGQAWGGGILNFLGGKIYVTNCTFAGGSCYGGTNGVGGTNALNGNIGAVYGANINNIQTGVFVIQNSIIAYPTNTYNAAGTFSNCGFNLSSDGYPIFASISNSVNNIDPKLVYPLATNGGFTLSLDLEPDSPAYNAIPTNHNYAYATNDQRGYPRPQSSAVDIGAVEYGTPLFTLSGQLLGGSASITNVTIIAQGNGSAAATKPDVNGNYTFQLPADIYTITPQPTNSYSFFPLFATKLLGPTNQVVSGVSFNATATFMLGGYITNLTAQTTVSVYIKSNGNNTFYLSTVTGTNAVYIFTNLPAGNTYTIIPAFSTTEAFNPPSFVYTLNMDNTNENFTEVPQQFSLGGTITNSGGAPITVYANISGGNTIAFTTTEANGNYSFPNNLPANSYTLVPQYSGLTFTPSSIFISVPPSTNNQNFTAQASSGGVGTNVPTAGSYVITGSITNLPGSVLVNIYYATNSSNIFSQTTTTNSTYTFTNLFAADYIIAPQATNWVTYSPSNLPVTVSLSTPTATNISFAVNPPIPFFTNQISLGSNVYYLANTTNNFFGYYSMYYYPYVYHYDLGFSYFIDANNAGHGAYLYDFTSGHFWYTEPGLLPYIYDFSFNSWMYCYPNFSIPERFYTNPRIFGVFNGSTNWFD